MNDLISNPDIQNILITVAVFVAGVVSPKVFGFLKKLTGKTKTTFDDELVAKLEAKFDEKIAELKAKKK